MQEAIDPIATSCMATRVLPSTDSCCSWCAERSQTEFADGEGGPRHCRIQVVKQIFTLDAS